jgi:hypothetical protein
MSRHSLSAVAAAALLLVASPLAHAATVGKTVEGKALSVDVNCVDRVEIQPQPDLNGKVMIEATSSDASDLTDFAFTGGETASVTRPHHDFCLKITDVTRKILVMIHVPAGTPIDIDNADSTDFVIGAVGGALHASLSGSGNISEETVTALDLKITGSSDVRVGQLSGATSIQIAGSGDVKIASATIPSMKIDIRGSGDVSVGQGQIDMLSASVAGSGDITIHSTVKDAALATTGSGDIDVIKVTGALSSSKAGSGSIRIGRAGPG